ncbi:MAG: DUF1800 domain-containing protein [Lewinella sp.]|nr:DUF1800 domain-containing protein [Lewinella sp.]
MFTAPPLNCATGTLAPYVPSAEVPWNRDRVQHLYRRLGFGATLAQLSAGVAMSPGDLVDQLLDTAAATPPYDEPEWANWTTADYDDFNSQRIEQFIEYARRWTEGMLEDGIREKMTLFWHNHFVTRFEDYFCPSYLYSYHTLLQEKAFGNFRDFVYEVGINSAMLVFLNGVQNTRFSPNENYARELYELFTLGQDNGYTQQDIVETAKALTGYIGGAEEPFCQPLYFVDFFHDNGTKTIFGQTGNWGYDDVIDILFTERADQIATHICSKLYRHFVHFEVDEAIVAGLAQTLRDNDWELLPVYKQLFKSEHFFDEYVIGVYIKSPIDIMVGFFLDAGLPYNAQLVDIILYGSSQQGQAVFNPVDVAGWPGNRSWIDANALTGRWQYFDAFIFNAYQNTPQVLVTLAQELSDDSNDPYLVTQTIVDYFVPMGLFAPEDYDRATDIFKWEVPQNYFDNGEWNLYWETAPAQVALLLRYISRLPEFQLS